MQQSLRSLVMLSSLALLVNACGGNPSSAAPVNPSSVAPAPVSGPGPAAPAPEPTTPQPAADSRCPAAQQWFEPGCKRDSQPDYPFTAGCFTPCDADGTSAPATCPAGFTCTRTLVGIAFEGGDLTPAVCGTGRDLCMPAK